MTHSIRLNKGRGKRGSNGLAEMPRFFSRRLGPLPVWAWSVVALTGGVAALVVYMQRESIMSSVKSLTGWIVQQGQELAFQAAIPAEARPLASVYLNVGDKVGVDPFLLVALAMRESRSGAALSADGTGDKAARTWANPQLPPDGLGWGRGIMQIDYGSNAEWLNSHDWRNPAENIAKGAEILLGKLRFFTVNGAGKTVTLSAEQAQKRGVAPGNYPDPRPLSGDALNKAAIAAYNTGEGNVLKSLAAGAAPDVTSTGANYSSDVLAKVSSMVNAFSQSVA